MRSQWRVKNKFLGLLAQPAEAPGVVSQCSRQTFPRGKQQPSSASWVGWLTGWTMAHGLSCGHTSLTWCPERVPYGTYQWGVLGEMMKQGAQTLLEGPLLSSSESFSIFLPLKFSNSYFKVIFLWDDIYYLSNALPRGKLQKNNYSLWITYHKYAPGTIL